MKQHRNDKIISGGPELNVKEAPLVEGMLIRVQSVSRVSVQSNLFIRLALDKRPQFTSCMAQPPRIQKLTDRLAMRMTFHDAQLRETTTPRKKPTASTISAGESPCVSSHKQRIDIGRKPTRLIRNRMPFR